MWKPILFLLFCAFAAAEVAALVIIGGWLGVGWTLAWMLGSVVLGLTILRLGGIQALIRIHHKLREQELPTLELLDMAMVLMGGVMLIVPGFVSDALGLLLLLPPVRWLGRGCFCALYGELLPPRYPPGRGPMGEEVIEIRAEEVRD